MAVQKRTKRRSKKLKKPKSPRRLRWKRSLRSGGELSRHPSGPHYDFLLANDEFQRNPQKETKNKLIELGDYRDEVWNDPSIPISTKVQVDRDLEDNFKRLYK